MVDETLKATPTDISLMLGSGVYLLKCKGVVVYVGQSVELWRRLYTHLNKKWIAFDAVEVIACAKYDLSRIEAQLVEQYAPKGNVKRLRSWPEKTLDLASLGLRPKGMRRRRLG